MQTWERKSLPSSEDGKRDVNSSSELRSPLMKGMVETIDRLASQAGTHIQKGEPSSVPEQKDQA